MCQQEERKGQRKLLLLNAQNLFTSLSQVVFDNKKNIIYIRCLILEVNSFPGDILRQARKLSCQRWPGFGFCNPVKKHHSVLAVRNSTLSFWYSRATTSKDRKRQNCIFSPRGNNNNDNIVQVVIMQFIGFIVSTFCPIFLH